MLLVLLYAEPRQTDARNLPSFR